MHAANSTVAESGEKSLKKASNTKEFKVQGHDSVIRHP
jgi:hypothetical protein